MKTILLGMMTTLLLMAQGVQAQRMKYQLENERMVCDITIGSHTKAHACIDLGLPVHIIDSTWLAKSGLPVTTRKMHVNIPFPFLKCQNITTSQMVREKLTINGMQTYRPVFVANLRKLSEAMKVKDMDVLLGNGLMAEDSLRTVTLFMKEQCLVWGNQDKSSNRIKAQTPLVTDSRFLIAEGSIRIVSALNDVVTLSGRFLIDPDTPRALTLYGGNEEVAKVISKSSIAINVVESQYGPLTIIPKGSVESLGVMATHTDIYITTDKAIPFIGVLGREWVEKANITLNFDSMKLGCH